jgi:hypothetical protein
VFEESNRALEFEALEGTGFILGSAVKHPHDLVLGTIPYIRAGRHLTEAKQESEKSASGFGRKVVFRAIARLYQTEQLELALGQ